MIGWAILNLICIVFLTACLIFGVQNKDFGFVILFSVGLIVSLGIAIYLYIYPDTFKQDSEEAADDHENPKP